MILERCDVLLRTGAEVVDDDDVVAGVEEFFSEVGTDETGATGDEVFHEGAS